MGRTIRQRWGGLLLVMFAVMLSGWHYDCGSDLPVHCLPAIAHRDCDTHPDPPVHHGECDRTVTAPSAKPARVAPVTSVAAIPALEQILPTRGACLPSHRQTPPHRPLGTAAPPRPARAPPSRG